MLIKQDFIVVYIKLDSNGFLSLALRTHLDPTSPLSHVNSALLKECIIYLDPKHFTMLICI